MVALNARVHFLWRNLRGTRHRCVYFLAICDRTPFNTNAVSLYFYAMICVVRSGPMIVFLTIHTMSFIVIELYLQSQVLYDRNVDEMRSYQRYIWACVVSCTTGDFSALRPSYLFRIVHVVLHCNQSRVLGFPGASRMADRYSDCETPMLGGLICLIDNILGLI